MVSGWVNSEMGGDGMSFQFSSSLEQCSDLGSSLHCKGDDDDGGDSVDEDDYNGNNDDNGVDEKGRI